MIGEDDAYRKAIASLFHWIDAALRSALLPAGEGE